MTLEIQTDPTPNPNAMKFTLNVTVSAKPISVTTADTAAIYPLATKLFALPGVKGLYMLNNFISVNKEPAASWEALLPAIQTVLTSQFSAL